MTTPTHRAASAPQKLERVLVQNVEAGGGHPGPPVRRAHSSRSDIKNHRKSPFRSALTFGALREFAPEISGENFKKVFQKRSGL
jgi:hypothetical protein